MSQLDFSKLDSMTDEEERQFMAAFTKALSLDDGEEAKRHLAAGRAIYYCDDRFEDAVVKEYPDGSRQVVTFRGGTEVVLRSL